MFVYFYLVNCIVVFVCKKVVLKMGIVRLFWEMSKGILV